jgi:hypothetical protein
MFSVSVAEMLKLCGKWVRATEFVDFISRRRKISTRQAHNLIKKAVSNGEIIRVPLRDRSVLYGLAEFGPTESVSLVEDVGSSADASTCSEHSRVPIDSVNQKRYGRPCVPFEITQMIYDRQNQRYLPPHFRRPFPSVGFNMFNLNDYPIKVGVEVRMILGGRNRGLIPDAKGHYNGKAEWGFEPGHGLVNGNFTVPEECAKSDEELTLEARVTVIDPDNREHRLLPKSWTYMREKVDWYYEPRLFTKE